MRCSICGSISENQSLRDAPARLGLFRDERGLTTVSMVVSLLLTVSLLFSVAQIYRVNSLSARVQDVADAAAIASESQVADFVLAARLCDAVALSLSLTSLVSYGVGVVALCVPGGQAAGDGLIDIAGKVSKARDDFAEKASRSLDSLQKALPYLCAVRSASVAAANNDGAAGSRYLGVSFIVPVEGADPICEAVDTSVVEQEIEGEAKSLKEQARMADEAAKAAASMKQEAFERDCGDCPNYCLYERADKLANLSSAENPLYTSVDAWSFSVALDRARAYYAARMRAESPADDSAKEHARSVLRLHFYEYAAGQLEGAYVREESDSFEAYFPKLPRSVEQMKSTSLYTDEVYPATFSDDGLLIAHAWEGCPQAQGANARVSLEQVEKENCPVCPSCEFSASSMGLVAAASTSVENGFEYHYEAIANAAEKYEKARSELDPVSQGVKTTAGGLLKLVKDAVSTAGKNRIEVNPPGAIGTVTLAVDMGSPSQLQGFNVFAKSNLSLGPRIAVSGATLLAEESDEGRNAINSVLDGYKDLGVAAGAAGIVLDCWSSLLVAYADGQGALLDAVEKGLDSVPLAGSSGLGRWAADTLQGLFGDIGLAPAEVESLKPVLINTGHVAAMSEDRSSARYLEVKTRMIENPSSSTDLLSSVADGVQSEIEERISGIDSITIAEIQILGNGPMIRIEVPLPPSAKDASISLVQEALSRFRSLCADLWGGDLWE